MTHCLRPHRPGQGLERVLQVQLLSHRCQPRSRAGAAFPHPMRTHPKAMEGRVWARPLGISFSWIFPLYVTPHLSAITVAASGGHWADPWLPFMTIICSYPEDHLLPSTPDTRCMTQMDLRVPNCYTGWLTFLTDFTSPSPSARTKHKLRNYLLPEVEFHTNGKTQQSYAFILNGDIYIL